MYYLMVASEIVWLVITVVGVAITAWALNEALKDQKAIFKEGINGTSAVYTREHVNQEVRSLIACVLGVVGGVVRYYIPNEGEDLGRAMEMWISTAIVIAIIGLLVVASLRRLQLRASTLAVFKSTQTGDFLSRNALLEAIWTTTALLVIDMQTGTILHATRPAEQIFGYHMVGDIRGRSVEDLVPEHLRVQHRHHRERFAQHPEARPMGTLGMTLMGLKRNGEVFPVEIGLCAAIIEGRECVIASVADATKRAIGNVHGTSHGDSVQP